MVMKAMRYGASNRFIKFFLFGLLMMAAIGLAFTGGSSFTTGGVGQSDVAKIGNETISVVSFDRSLRQALGRIGIPVGQAYQMGYVDQFLGNEVRGRILTHAANDAGITVSHDRVGKQVRKMIEPMVKDGQDPKQVLEQILMSQGMSERELVDSISRETAAGIIGKTLQGGFEDMPDNLLVDLYKAQNESRVIDYVVFMDADVKDLRAPTDEDLKKLYKTSKEMYAIPETRVLKLIKIKDEALKKTLEITDEELKQAYDSNIDAYRTPAQHTLEQSLFVTEDLAKQMYDAVKGGKTMDQASRDMKQISSYLGKLEVEDTKIHPELKDAVMAAKEGELLQPMKNKLGWNVIKVTKVSAENTKSFESVKTELKNDLYDTKLVDQKYALANQLDDLLASGANLDDVVKQADVDVTTLPAMNSFGQGADKSNALSAYEKIASRITETGFGLNEGETSPVSEMADGSFMAINVQSVTPKTYKSFEDVKAELDSSWRRDLAKVENLGRASTLLSYVFAGTKKLGDGGSVKTITLSRMGQPPADLSPQFMGSVFKAKLDQPVQVPMEGGIIVAVAKSATWPQDVNKDSEDFKKFKDALTKDAANESLATYIDNKGRKYKAATNEGLIDKIYGQSADTAAQ